MHRSTVSSQVLEALGKDLQKIKIKMFSKNYFYDMQ
jgi:hypothetical protein